VLRLGQSYLSSSRFPRLVQPFIQRISMQCGETINVSILDGHEVVYVARSNAPRLVSIGFHIGARAPAHVVTPGVAMLSTFSDKELDAWIAAHTFSGFTAQTVTDPQKFKSNVQAARQLGYWITDQNLELGVRGLAMPLINRKGDCVAAIGCTVQCQQYSLDDLAFKLFPLLRDTAQALRDLL